MLTSMDHAHIRAYFLAIVTTLLTVLTVYMMRPFLVTVGLAAVFAVIFTPLHKWFQRAKFSETFASFATLLIGVICVAVPTIFVSVQFLREAQNVYGIVSEPGSVVRAQTAISGIGHSLDRTIPGAAQYMDAVAANFAVYVSEGLSWGIGHAGAFFAGTLDFFLQLFIFMMTLYYLLKEGPRLKLAIERFSPLAMHETAQLIDRMVHTISSVVRGTFFVALIQGALTAIGFMIFGIPNGVLWGIITIVASLIPSLGTAFVIVPAVLYLFFIGHAGAAWGLAIFGALGIGLVDNVLRPYLMSGNSSIHPLLILLSVIGGLAFFGPGGLFLGPLVISLLLGLLSIYTPSRGETV